MEGTTTEVHLKTQLSKNEHFECKLTIMGKFNSVCETIIRCLNMAELNEMSSRTQFGNLICSSTDFNLSSQMLWYLISRQTCRLRKDEFWMVIRKRPLRFSLVEYCLITGLNCSNSFPEIPDTLDFQLRHFQGRRIIRLSDLEKRFVEMVDASEDVNIEKLKLACLLFVVGVLGPRRSKADVIVSSWLLSLIEDFDSFNRYPWGTTAFGEVLKSLRKNLVGRREEVCAKDYGSLIISGFVQPLQILAYECIPGIANAFARQKEVAYSSYIRMCRWETRQWKKKGSPKYNNIVAAVNESEDIIGLLLPTSDEMRMDYYMTAVFEGSDSDENIERITFLLCQGRRVICSQRPVDTMAIDYAISQPSTVRPLQISPPSHSHFTTPLTGHEIPFSPQHHDEVPPHSPSHEQYHFHRDEVPRYSSAQMNDDSSRFAFMFNDLRTCIDQGVRGLNERFDCIDQRLKGFDDQMNQLKVDVHGGFEEINRRLSILENERAASAGTYEGHRQPEVAFRGTSEGYRQPEVTFDDAGSSEAVFETPDHRIHERKNSRILVTPFTVVPDSTPVTRYQYVDEFHRLCALRVRRNGGVMENELQNMGPDEKRHGLDKKFFTELLSPGSWLEDEHMKYCLKGLLKIQKTYPDHTSQDIAVMDIFFHQVLQTEAQHNEVDENLILRYILGINDDWPSTPWGNSRLIVFTVHLPRHWIAVKVDLNTGSTTILDSATSAFTMRALHEHIKGIRVLLPRLLNSYGLVSKPKIELKRCSEFPQQKLSGECGVYALRAIATELVGGNLNVLNDDIIADFRKFMALCIWENEWTV